MGVSAILFGFRFHFCDEHVDLVFAEVSNRATDYKCEGETNHERNFRLVHEKSTFMGP